MTDSIIGLPSEKSLKVATILVAIIFCVAGVSAFIEYERMLTAFDKWGYPSGFHVMVGSLQLLAVAGLFLRPYAKFAAAGLVLVMLGAVATKILHDPFVTATAPSLILFLCMFLAVRLFRA